MTSTLQKHSVSYLWLLISIIACSGCANFNGKSQGIAFDHRDYIEIPKGTVIKDVPFYVNGNDQQPVTMDYTTSQEGAWFSIDAEKVLKK